jgi:hypothetical protein
METLCTDLVRTIYRLACAPHVRLVCHAWNIRWMSDPDTRYARAPRDVVVASVAMASLYLELCPDTKKWLGEHAALCGNLSVVQWAHARRFLQGKQASAHAAEGGSLLLLEWLVSSGYPVKASTYLGAARGGHLHVLRWLRARRCPWHPSVYTQAAKSGQLAVLRWLHRHRYSRPSDLSVVSTAAIIGGHLPILHWLTRNGYPIDQKICYYAAYYGHLHVLLWARTQGYQLSASTCGAAAIGGHQALMEWLHANGCPMDEWSCWGAARNGDLALLQWLRERGCPWNTHLTTVAAAGGHLGVLRWAHQQGCPLSGMIYIAVALNPLGIEIAEWAFQNNCPWEAVNGEGLASMGCVSLLAWAHQHKLPLGNFYATALKDKCFKILQWAQEVLDIPVPPEVSGYPVQVPRHIENWNVGLEQTEQTLDQIFEISSDEEEMIDEVGSADSSGDAGESE